LYLYFFSIQCVFQNCAPLVCQETEVNSIQPKMPDWNALEHLNLASWAVLWYMCMNVFFHA
jgi:hypothetical protein